VIAAAAWLIAIIFLLPYLEMLVTALRPQRELLERSYLPHHFAWSNLTGRWGPGFGITSSLRVSLEVAGRATLVVTLVALPAAYYTARHRFAGRGAFLLLVLATQILQPTALIVGIYREFLSFHLIDTIWLDSFIGQYTVDWQHLFGASVVATIPVLVLFALIERRVVSGLTAGSIR
jgi:multiple sugar transport system permease protein